LRLCAKNPTLREKNLSQIYADKPSSSSANFASLREKSHSA
jgi:hypothetical protein